MKVNELAGKQMPWVPFPFPWYSFPHSTVLFIVLLALPFLFPCLSPLTSTFIPLFFPFTPWSSFFIWCLKLSLHVLFLAEIDGIVLSFPPKDFHLCCSLIALICPSTGAKVGYYLSQNSFGLLGVFLPNYMIIHFATPFPSPLPYLSFSLWCCSDDVNTLSCFAHRKSCYI